MAVQRFRSIEEIEGYPIGNGLKLGDVARVEDVKTVRDSLFRIDGRYAYFGQIQKDGQANVVETCKRLKRELAALEQDPQLGGEFQFLPIFDQGLVAIVEDGGRLRFAARTVVLDSRSIDTLLVIPL